MAVSPNSRTKPKSKKSKWATDHICTAAEAAALDFEPWVGCQEPPTNEEWIKAINPYLMSARVAWVTCQKTKPELVKIVEGLEEEELIKDFLDRLDHGQEFFKYFHELFNKAEARIMCAGSVLEVRDEDNQPTA